METKQTYENLNETLILGFNSIFKIVGIQKILFSKWINYVPIIISLCFTLICYLLKVNIFEIIVEITSLMISFLPGILGFTVAGYSLMIGLIQAGMLNNITEPKSEENKFSLYQIMSATFAANVIIQAISLLIAFAYYLLNFIDSRKEFQFHFSSNFINMINLIGLIMIFYFFSISLLMIIQVIINIFNFSQLHHYFVNKEKIRKKEAK